MIKFLFGIMGKFFSKLETPVEIGEHDSIKELEKSANCYCGSNKKYKHCHRKVNLKEKQIAITITNTKTNVSEFKLVYKEDVDRYNGISIKNNYAKNTFGLVELQAVARESANNKNNL